MPRDDLSTSQIAAITGRETKPVYLLAWEHSGVEELIACTAGDVVFDGMPFNRGDVRIQRIREGRDAALQMPASPTRNAETQSGSWRNGSCKIYQIPAVPADELTFLQSAAVLVLSGQIRSSKLAGDVINVICGHVKAGVRNSPRHTFDSVANHLPAAGTVITWEGSTVVLEPPR